MRSVNATDFELGGLLNAQPERVQAGGKDLVAQGMQAVDDGAGLIGMDERRQARLFGLTDAFDDEEAPLVAEAAVVEELQAMEVDLEGSASAVAIIAQFEEIGAHLLLGDAVWTDSAGMLLEADDGADITFLRFGGESGKAHVFKHSLS